MKGFLSFVIPLSIIAFLAFLAVATYQQTPQSRQYPDPEPQMITLENK